MDSDMQDVNPKNSGALPPANGAGAADGVSSAGPAASPSSAPGSGAAASPSPAPRPIADQGAAPGAAPATNQPNQPNQPPKDDGSWGHRVLNSVVRGLGGGDNVTYMRDPQTGKMAEVHTPATPGQSAKNIIASAIQGAIAGAGAKPGPGNALQAFSAGGNAVQDFQEKRRNQKMKVADEDYEAQQKMTVQKAQVALLNQEVSERSFNLGRARIKSQFEDSDRENEFVRSIQNGGEHSQDLGVVEKPEGGDYFHALLKLHQDMPDLMKQQAQGNVIGIPHVNAKGELDGMRYALVTPEWKASKLDQDEVFFKLMPPEKPGQAPKVGKEIVKAGTMTNGDFWTRRMAAEKEIQDIYMEQYKQGQEDKRQDTAQAGENQRSSAKIASEEKIANINANAKVAAAGRTAERKDIAEHDKNYVQPMRQAQVGYEIFDHAYQEYKAAAAKNQSLPTGAQSMVALSQHLNNTFGGVKGARLTKDMIQEHLGARSVSDAARVAFQKLTNGDQLSPAQWEAFHDTVSEGRRAKVDSAVAEARRKNIPVDFLPMDLEGSITHKVGDVVHPDGNEAHPVRITEIGDNGQVNGEKVGW